MIDALRNLFVILLNMVGFFRCWKVVDVLEDRQSWGRIKQFRPSEMGFQAAHHPCQSCFRLVFYADDIRIMQMVFLTFVRGS